MDRMFECRGAHGCARATVPVKESRNQMSVYSGRAKRSVPVGEGALAGMLTRPDDTLLSRPSSCCPCRYLVMVGLFPLYRQKLSFETQHIGFGIWL